MLAWKRKQDLDEWLLGEQGDVYDHLERLQKDIDHFFKTQRKSHDLLRAETQSLCVDSLTRRSPCGESRYTKDMIRRGKGPLPPGDR